MPKPDSENAAPTGEASDHSSVAETKRVAARRRFLRMGAGGSTAILVTVVHKRAFAGGTSVKKNTVVSHCISIGGTPNIKGMDQKKALQVSAGGTLKNATCYAKGTGPSNTCGVPGGTTPVYGFVQDNKGNWKVGVVANVPVYSDSQMKNGCGDLDDMINSPLQYNYRLYKKFYCPVKIENGVIKYYPSGTGTPNPYQPLGTPVQYTKMIDNKGKSIDPCAGNP